jgi:hypothetical protein
LEGGQALQQGHGLFAGQSACSPIGDPALGVEGAEIPAGGHAAFLDRQADPGRFKHSSTNPEFQRVVSKEGQVGRAGPWGYSRKNRDALAGRTFLS